MNDNFDPRCHLGERHGIYTIIDVLNDKDKYGHYIYKGVCSKCGHEKLSHYGGFSGYSHIANVCNHLGVNGKYINPTRWRNKRIGRIFSGMKARCYNINNYDYQWYGGRGIKICDEWVNTPKLFEDWAMVNGYEDNLSIDRVDETKNYCPENCRWVSLIGNSKYKSTTSLVNVDGEVHTGREWADILGLGTNTINKYIRKYGLNNTIEFIKRFMMNPVLEHKCNQSYYDIYMNN